MKKSNRDLIRPLVVFMTPGISIDIWRKRGILEREIKFLKGLVRLGWDIKIISWGTPKENILNIEGIEIVSIKYKKYRLVNWEVLSYLGNARIAITRQTSFCFQFVLPCLFKRVPLVVWGGYVQGEYLESTKGTGPKTRTYQVLEALAFHAAKVCVVSTNELSDWVKKKYYIGGRKIKVIDNYVDCNLFKKLKHIKPVPRSVISVGRLEPVKRFDLLLRACAKAKTEQVTIIGSGREEYRIRQIAKALDINLSLPGSIDNGELPIILQKHEVFALTSLREGHPKALAEALSCGMPCVVTNSPGIRSLVNNEIAILAESSEHSISEALNLVFRNREVRDQLSLSAETVSNKRFDFETILNKFHKILISHSV